MDAQLLKTVGSIAGVAGIALGIILLIYTEIVRRPSISKLSQKRSFELLRLIVIASWSIGVLGLGVWYWAQQPASNNPATTTTHGDRSPIVQGAGGNVGITIGNDSSTQQKK